MLKLSGDTAPARTVKTTAFFVGLAITIMLLTAAFDRTFDAGFPLKQKERALSRLLEQNHGRLDYLFVGDSHAHDAIELPELNGVAFNFGNGGESYIEMYFHLRDLLADPQVRIGALFVELDPSMSLKDARRRFGERTYYYRNKMSLAEVCRILPERSLVTLWLTRRFGFLGRGEFFTLAFTPPVLDPSGNTIKSRNVWREIPLEPVEHRPDTLALSYLGKILGLASGKVERIVLITYPVTHAAIQSIPADIVATHRAGIERALEQALPDKGYAVLDYRSLFVQYPEYFANSSHLNHDGAVLLTRRIRRDMDKFGEQPVKPSG